MAIGTTNISLRDSLYVEMGKSAAESNYSLGRCQYGQNDIDITQYAADAPTLVSMAYWQGYDHSSLQFRVNPYQTDEGDTYDATNGIAFGNPIGMTATRSGVNTADPQGWDFDPGSNSYVQFEGIGSNAGYKVGATGFGTTCFWVKPRDNSSGQTVVLGNNLPVGSVSAYYGDRFDITTAMRIRNIRGDGGGTASSNRRTFQSSGVLQQDQWNFVVWQGEYNSVSLGTSANYFWIYNQPYGWQAGATFLSGTGGNKAYEGSSGGSLVISSASNGGRYFDGSVANIYAFNERLDYSTEIQTLRSNTDVYTA